MAQGTDGVNRHRPGRLPVRRPGRYRDKRRKHERSPWRKRPQAFTIALDCPHCFPSFLAAMRSTKASAAVARLNARDPEHQYSMGMTASGFFYLLRMSDGGVLEKISGDLTMEEFVELANRTGPQKKVKIGKLDAAFEKQLTGKSGKR